MIKLFRLSTFLAGPWLFLNMILLPLNWDAIFYLENSFSLAEFVLIMGFLLIFLLDAGVFVLSWMPQKVGLIFSSNRVIMRFVSFFGIILLFLVKFMLDEIARELQLGWEVRGEFILLICALLVHLLFNLYYMTILNKPEPQTQAPV